MSEAEETSQNDREASRSGEGPLSSGEAARRWHIRFRFDPHLEVLAMATDPAAYLSALHDLGECQVTPRTVRVPTLDRLNPGICHLYWEIILTAACDEQTIRDEFEFIEMDLAELIIKQGYTQLPPVLPEEEPVKPQQSEADGEGQESAHAASSPAKKLRILIADDEFNNRFLLRNYMQSFGECDMVVDGQEALEAFEIALEEENPYDLVLLDIMMPNVSGQEALKRIRALERERAGQCSSAETVIIMVTALNAPQDVIEAFYMGGCSDYIAKPVTREVLVEKMKEFDLLKSNP